MSVNETKEIDKKYFLNYIASILNIDLNNPILVIDIQNELSKIDNLPSFIHFIKERFNNSKYDFLTGIQKFILLVKDYQDEKMYKLDNEDEEKILNFSQRLYSQTTDFFNELEFIGKQSKINLQATIENTKNGFSLKQLEVLKSIGYETAYRLAILSPTKLETLIEETILKLAKQKKIKTLAIGYEANNDKAILNKIKGLPR